MEYAGKTSDDALSALTKWIRSMPEYMAKLEPEAIKYLKTRWSRFTENGIADDILKALEKECGGLADDAVMGLDDVKSVVEKTAKISKYTEEEIIKILDNIRGDGFKNNPLRQAYEKEVEELKSYGEKLLESGMLEEQVARALNQARRDLGVKYKDMTPQPLRDYIYEINIERYSDKLGPTYDWLVTEKGVTALDIINSSSRPNSDIDKLLSGFEKWLRSQSL